MPAGPAPIDVDAAWTLVQAARSACPGAGRPVALAAHPDTPPALEVDPGGAWRSATDVTPGAAELLDLYLPLCATPGPRLALAQSGQSLDGRIATESGHSRYVTGPADIVHLHRLRALVDAVIVGAATAALDDPRLTVRRVPGANPTRVVIDPKRRVPATATLFRDGAAPTLLLCTEGSTGAHADTVEALTVAPGAAGLEPADVLERLAARGLARVLVEGGGDTVSRFLAAGVLDRLHVTVAPVIVGSGRAALALPPIAHLDEALRPRWRRFDLGDDVLFDLRLR